MNNEKYEMVNYDYHRNGIAGEGFYTGLIRWTYSDDDNDKERTMVFVHFPNWDDDGRYLLHKGGDVKTAILDADLVGEKDIKFGINSWRGDHFHDWIIDTINHDKWLLKKQERVSWESVS